MVLPVAVEERTAWEGQTKQRKRTVAPAKAGVQSLNMPLKGRLTNWVPGLLCSNPGATNVVGVLTLKERRAQHAGVGGVFGHLDPHGVDGRFERPLPERAPQRVQDQTAGLGDPAGEENHVGVYRVNQ